MANARTSDRLETYLSKVRAQLRGLPDEEISEVVAELRSHVMDFTGGDLGDANVAQALAKLGEPQEIARVNLSMRVAAQSLDRRSLWAVIRTVGRLARLSARGLVVFLISLIGYAFAGSCFLTALAKPFVPDRVGLWQLPDPADDLSFSIGLRQAGVAGHELLGWWIVPLGLLLGLGFGYLTYLYDRWAIRRMALGRKAPAP